MGMNFLKKLFGNKEKVSEPKNIKDELKTILNKKWEEQKKATEGLPFDELYNQMVEEAVLTIEEEWRRDAEYFNNFKCPVNELEIEAYETFFITENLTLHSNSLYRPTNPKTRKTCFYSNFTFPNAELAEQYIADITALLPEGTCCIYRTTERPGFGRVIVYSFTVKLANLLED